MSKHIKSQTGPINQVQTVPGTPVSASFNGNQVTVNYEDNPSTQHKVQAFTTYSEIPDTAGYFTTVGNSSTTYYLYIVA